MGLREVFFFYEIGRLKGGGVEKDVGSFYIYFQGNSFFIILELILKKKLFFNFYIIYNFKII